MLFIHRQYAAAGSLSVETHPAFHFGLFEHLQMNLSANRISHHSACIPLPAWMASHVRSPMTGYSVRKAVIKRSCNATLRNCRASIGRGRIHCFSSHPKFSDRCSKIKCEPCIVLCHRKLGLAKCGNEKEVNDRFTSDVNDQTLVLAQHC